MKLTEIKDEKSYDNFYNKYLKSQEINECKLFHGREYPKNYKDYLKMTNDKKVEKVEIVEIVTQNDKEIKVNEYFTKHKEFSLKDYENLRSAVNLNITSVGLSEKKVNEFITNEIYDLITTKTKVSKKIKTILANYRGDNESYTE